MSPLAQRTRRVDPSRFSMVPRADIPRSQFRTTATYKTTLNAGVVVPVYVDEVLPGDSFRVSATGFARMSTPLFPVMDNLWLDWFWFFVPYRLVWTNFLRFMGERDNVFGSVDFLVPQVTSPVGGYAVGSVYDYMGLPTVGQVEAASTVTHNSLALRAYNKIWNDWFRDENLQIAGGATINEDDGPDAAADYVLLPRGKRHDYFTSCLPWPEKPIAPLDTLSADQNLGRLLNRPDRGAAISGLGVESAVSANLLTNQAAFETGRAPVSTIYENAVDINAMAAGDRIFMRLSTGGAAFYPELRVTIQAIREAYMIQTLMERDARGGTRYTELIRAHFGVTSPDARLQRPEYLGGGSTQITFNPVPQTSSTDATTPQANLAAFAHFSHRGAGFVKSFTEHGVLLGLMSVRADLNYQQGLNRMWSRSTKYDYYWPALSHIGEQAVLNKEIYVQGTADPTADEAVFGYQERFAEYRYKPSLITGQFRSTYATPLDQWHLAQEFSSLPVLNSTFIQDTPPVARVSAVPTEPDFLFDAIFELKTARCMPTYSVPGLIDHF